MRNYFNLYGIMAQVVCVSKHLSLILVFSRLITSTIRTPQGRGGVGSLLRRSVPGLEVPLRNPLHAVAVRIHLRRVYTVCSMYLAPDVPIVQDDLVKLLHQLPEPFFLAGDLNIHHPSWYNGDT